MSARTPSLRELRANRPENVVILPTASPRQVQQNCNKASRAAKHQLKYQHAERFPYCQPWIRKQQERAKVLADLSPTPELLIAAAIIKALPAAARAKVLDTLAAQCHHKAGRTAFEYINISNMTVGDEFALIAAMDALRDGKIT